MATLSSYLSDFTRSLGLTPSTGTQTSGSRDLSLQPNQSIQQTASVAPTTSTVALPVKSTAQVASGTTTKPTAQMATLFDPKTGARVAVEVGSKQANDLFSKGYKLETATQNYQTYNAAPQKEILQGPGTELYSRVAGQEPVKIADPRELTALVQQGYQDTRRPISSTPYTPVQPQTQPQTQQMTGISGVGLDTRAITGISGLPSGISGMRQVAIPQAQQIQSPINTPETFQQTLQQLLRQSQGLGGDADLMRQRNELIQRRFNAIQDVTPTTMQGLSPTEQASLRRQQEAGFESQLGGVSAALQTRERERATARENIQVANQILKDFQTDERANRDDARQLITSMVNSFGSDAFSGASKEDLARLEGQAGMPAGSLSSGMKTLKQREMEAKSEAAAAKAAETRYGPGSIGEYQFYAEQELASGREPMSYNEYQNMDANRKAVASSQGLSTAQMQSTINSIAGAFDNEPIVKNFNVVMEGLQAAQEYANNPSSSNDQALVYAFAKAMDPNSVVRESEYATVQKYAQSWASQFGFDVKKLYSGDPQFLTQDARNKMVNTIQTKFDIIQNQYNNLRNQYQQSIESVKSGNVGRMITDYGGAYTSPQPQAVSPLSASFEDYLAKKENEAGMSYSPEQRETLRSQFQSDPLELFNKPPSTGLKGSTSQGSVSQGSVSQGTTSLGSLSAKYESSGKPGVIGYDRTGGYSYGSYQLAHNNALSFVQQSPYAKYFQGIPFNSQAFQNKWKQVAKQDPKGFGQAQHDYIAKTHYQPQTNLLAKNGIDINKYSPILKNVIWSTAVQHGPGTNIIASAIKSLGKNASEADIIKKIYSNRWSGGKNFAGSTTAVKNSVYNRFFGKNGEMNLALSQLKQYT